MRGGNMFWETDSDRYHKAHNKRQREQNERRRQKAREYAAREKEQEIQKRDANAKTNLYDGKHSQLNNQLVKVGHEYVYITQHH